MSELKGAAIGTLTPAAYGPVLGRGSIRTSAADFQVVELPVFEPSGDGEHALLEVRKSGANTEWVARELARFAGVQRRAVGYAGRKDRHALTEQWFSVHLPGCEGPDWRTLRLDGVEIISSHRHGRKVRKGALRGNRFRIVVRGIDAPAGMLDARLRQVAERGFPNYFGEQRFGHEQRNVRAALEWFSTPGRRRPPQSDLLLSAARSLLFNALLARRVSDGSWREALPGDRLMLDGSESSFVCVEPDQIIDTRVAGLDLHPTGPLWGRGDPPVEGEVLALERDLIADYQPLASGLERLGLRQDRRALRTRARDLCWSWRAPDCLTLSFELGRGSYATVMLEQLLDLQRPV